MPKREEPDVDREHQSMPSLSLASVTLMLYPEPWLKERLDGRIPAPRTCRSDPQGSGGSPRADAIDRPRRDHPPAAVNSGKFSRNRPGGAMVGAEGWAIADRRRDTRTNSGPGTDARPNSRRGAGGGQRCSRRCGAWPTTWRRRVAGLWRALRRRPKLRLGG